MNSDPSSRKPLSALAGIVYGGLTVGVLDASAATLLTIWFGGDPMQMWQGVASGLLGGAAFRGGVLTMLVGLLAHFFIAFNVVLVYHLASKRIATLWRHPLICGPLYGVAVYFFMQLVVIALVFPDRRPLALLPVIRGIVVHIIAVGTPTALFARKAKDATIGVTVRGGAGRSAQQHA